jgi:hypothetical protein
MEDARSYMFRYRVVVYCCELTKGGTGWKQKAGSLCRITLKGGEEGVGVLGERIIESDIQFGGFVYVVFF